MAQLQDLLEKNLADMTTEELEAHIIQLKRLRFVEPIIKEKPEKKPKSNKDRQMEDLFKNMTEEQMAEFAKMLHEARSKVDVAIDGGQ